MKLILPAILTCLILLSACSDLGYYVQSATGHFSVMQSCRPIDEVIADPQIPGVQKARLETLQEIRDFAVAELGLPDNDSYRTFADIGRPYVVWNVVAAPELSMTPKQWCFPVVGCVSYRGYFDEAEARDYAALLRQQGYEVDIYGVQAYSTLNWFDDPALNTFLSGSDVSLAALVFHELAHQVVYVADDSHFSEAFAKTVELEGVRRWLRAGQAETTWVEFVEQDRKVEAFIDLLMQTRTELVAIYAAHLEVDQKRAMKQQAIDALGSRYALLKEAWGGYAGFDGWFDRDVNNARLASVATYRELVPAFQALLASQFGRMDLFYTQVRQIGELEAPDRIARLNANLPVKQARTSTAPDTF